MRFFFEDNRLDAEFVEGQWWSIGIETIGLLCQIPEAWEVFPEHIGAEDRSVEHLMMNGLLEKRIRFSVYETGRFCGVQAAVDFQNVFDLIHAVRDVSIAAVEAIPHWRTLIGQPVEREQVCHTDTFTIRHVSTMWRTTAKGRQAIEDYKSNRSRSSDKRQQRRRKVDNDNYRVAFMEIQCESAEKHNENDDARPSRATLPPGVILGHTASGFLRFSNAGQTAQRIDCSYWRVST